MLEDLLEILALLAMPAVATLLAVLGGHFGLTVSIVGGVVGMLVGSEISMYLLDKLDGQ